ncbi:hypothetical protein JXA85_03120 [Candidatus Woesearchaeota archaeon]|nr:hypothetical protein [Candidatus Woesearchaeota archaeon]
MKQSKYFLMFLLVLVQLVALVLQLYAVHGIVLLIEGVVTLGFIFFSLVLLYSYKVDSLGMLGVLFFCFNLLNFMALYFVTGHAVLLFIAEIAAMIGLALCFEKKKPKKPMVLPEPPMPSVQPIEIIKEEKKASRRKKRKNSALKKHKKSKR